MKLIELVRDEPRQKVFSREELMQVLCALDTANEALAKMGAGGVSGLELMEAQDQLHCAADIIAPLDDMKVIEGYLSRGSFEERYRKPRRFEERVMRRVLGHLMEEHKAEKAPGFTPDAA